MEPIRLSDVLRATGGELAGPRRLAGAGSDPVLTSVSTDSRRVEKGALFVPLRGKRHDAHRFVEEAILAGASFSLVARDAPFHRLPPNVVVVRDTTRALGDLARWHRSRFDVPVVGITGSCGKTTVKEMVRAVLGDRVVASPASYNNEVGVPLTLLQMDQRTRAAVVEIGTNAPGEIAHLTGIARPTVGVLTNIEAAHLERLGSIRGVMEEKAALLEGLPDDGVAVVNADNYHCREVMEQVACHLVTFGTWEDADVYGTEEYATPDGVGFYLYGRLPVEVPALGLHNVANALAAVAVGLWLNRKPEQVREALARYQAPPMRMSREVVGGVVLVNDAYNANPRSMEAAILELSARPCEGRRVAVLGDMLELGEESASHHEALGRKVAKAGIDLLWGVGPGAERLVEEAVRTGMSRHAVAWSPGLEEAGAEPPFEARPGDAWLFKASRGMALETLLAEVRRRIAAADAPAATAATTAVRPGEARD
jgi:UDP-N-acetylmuramoyl-tripeptide--D-alanyl-D-alanine ligase